MIIKNESDLIEQYTTDASNMKGKAEIVYIPETISELKEVINECYRKDLPITISGAGTGMTGSRVALEGAVISTEKLNKILDIDPQKQFVVVQPGISLSDLENTLSEYNLFYPPNPTEKNGTIGANLATNASGSRTFKYGATRRWVEGVNLFLSNGEEILLGRSDNLFNCNSINLHSDSGNSYNIEINSIKIPDVKHAAGYYFRPNMDAIDLFIGSEGTLGVFSEIKLKVLRLPEKVIGAIIFFDDMDNLLSFVDEVREASKQNFENDYKIVNIISARLIEFFDYFSLEMLREKYPQLPQNAKGAIWIEQECIVENEDIILNNWYNLINRFTSLEDDTWIALNDKEHNNFRDFRHALPLQITDIVTMNHQKKIGTDTAVPDKFLHEYFKFIKNQVTGSKLPFVIFGHIGNSHFHGDLFTKTSEEYDRAIQCYNNCISEALRLEGTVSAEHGIGKLKKKYLLQMFGQDGIDEMKRIKQIFDPKNLLGRYNLFD